jgi:hypothetical protein
LREWKNAHPESIHPLPPDLRVKAETPAGQMSNSENFEVIKRLLAERKRDVDSCSGDRLSDPGYDRDVVLTPNQQRIRDAYRVYNNAWYGNGMTGVWSCLVVAVTAIPWLFSLLGWYLMLPPIHTDTDARPRMRFVDEEAPLRQWTVERAFDSAEPNACACSRMVRCGINLSGEIV